MDTMGTRRPPWVYPWAVSWVPMGSFMGHHGYPWHPIMGCPMNTHMDGRSWDLMGNKKNMSSKRPWEIREIVMLRSQNGSVD